MSFYDSHLRICALALLPALLGLVLLGCSKTEDSVVMVREPRPEMEVEAIPETDEPPQPDHLVNPPADPRAALAQALDNGLLAGNQSKNDKLRAMLEVAGVPEASQVLVFSKTSLQHRLIGPSNPRAIYFSDNCYLGYVPGGLVEYGDADPDPSIGSGMLAVDLRDAEKAELVQDGSCLACHDGARTNGGPGFFIRSVFPDAKGHVITSAGSTTVGQHTPLAKRWGGWYVTGNSGGSHHRGNQVTVEQANGDAYIDNALGSNIEDLSSRFNIGRYLQPTSDIVALMVLEHQVQMHNRLTQGSTVVHEQYERSKSLAKYLEEPFEPSKNETLQRVIASNAGRIVRQILFCNEIELTDPISGTDAFIHQFRANRKEDTLGRSLKDFDLLTRMFKYRCSYMVYSQAFKQLHPMLKDAVLEKLQTALDGKGDASVYGHLEEEERKAILHILQHTGVLAISDEEPATADSSARITRD
ncbi:MAG: hypothetical protein AAF085_06105 [Planctomycetota bacterium]